MEKYLPLAKSIDIRELIFMMIMITQ